MNWSRRKPTSCSTCPSSSPSRFAHCATLLSFPLSFPFLHFLSSSFFFSFLLPFRFSFLPVSIFFSLIFWFPLFSPHTHLPFHFFLFFSPFPPFSLFNPSSPPNSSHASTSPMHPAHGSLSMLPPHHASCTTAGVDTWQGLSMWPSATTLFVHRH